MKNGTILSVFLSILFIETALKAQDNNDYLKQLEQVYGNEEYFKMQEKFDSHQQSLARHKEEERKSRNLMLLISIAVGIIPAAVVVYRVIAGKIKPAGPGAIAKASFILVLGGAALGAANYLLLWMRHKGYQSLLIYIFLLFLIAGAIYLYTKKTN